MNLLVTGAVAWTKEELDLLKQLGHEVIFMQQEKDPLPCDAEWIEGIIGNGIFLSHSLEQFTSLRYIQLTSAGFDRVPLEQINERGIVINNARGVYSIPMAEFAVSGVLSLYKQGRFFTACQQKHSWEKHRGLLELFGKTVCVVGCGSVGNECAKRFAAFGCRVTGVDLYPRNDETYATMQSLDSLQQCVADADVVVLTLPLTDQTYHLFDEDLFFAMKNGSVLVNIARGAVVNQAALEHALKSKLMGAVLDVFEQEPLCCESLLWETENVIITPHNSFVGDGNKKRLFDLIIKNLERYDENNCSFT